MAVKRENGEERGSEGEGKGVWSGNDPGSAQREGVRLVTSALGGLRRPRQQHADRIGTGAAAAAAALAALTGTPNLNPKRTLVRARLFGCRAKSSF